MSHLTIATQSRLEHVNKEYTENININLRNAENVQKLF